MMYHSGCYDIHNGWSMHHAYQIIMLTIDIAQKLSAYRAALDAFIDRAKEDRWILAAVLVGSLEEDTIVKKENIYMWIIEADGVTLRKKSDGEEPRIWRVLVEQDVNIWAEIIPRSRFKRMVEGTSRTAFSYNFFSKRQLVYSSDESISSWFDDANTLAQRDQQNDLLISTTWLIHALRNARKIMDVEKDMERAWQAVLDMAHALAAVHIVHAGEICETPVIHRALALNPGLFKQVYTNVLTTGPDEGAIREAINAGVKWLSDHGKGFMEPITRYLKQQPRVIGISEIANQFAFSQLYPWHIEAACEWLAEEGELEKLATEMPLTKKSRIHLEEPAYMYHAR